MVNSSSLNFIKFILNLNIINACFTKPETILEDDGIKWSSKDCSNFSVWDESKKACRCNEGWSGAKCHVWANSSCYFGIGVNYRGNLGETQNGPCADWKDANQPRTKHFDKNYCRNPDEDSGGIWCFRRTLQKGREYIPDYCDAEKCSQHVLHYLRNTSSGLQSVEINENLDILYGPIIGGICGGLVALMTVMGVCEYLRRRRTFHRLRMRLDPEYATEQVEARAQKRKLGAVNVVDIDTGEVEQQAGFTAGGTVQLPKGAVSTIGDNAKSQIGGAKSTIGGGKSILGAATIAETTIGGAPTMIGGTSIIGSTMGQPVVKGTGPAINRLISNNHNQGQQSNFNNGHDEMKDNNSPYESDYGGGDEDDHDTGMMKFKKDRDDAYSNKSRHDNSPNRNKSPRSNNFSPNRNRTRDRRGDDSPNRRHRDDTKRRDDRRRDDRRDDRRRDDRSKRDQRRRDSKDWDERDRKRDRRDDRRDERRDDRKRDRDKRRRDSSDEDGYRRDRRR